MDKVIKIILGISLSRFLYYIVHEIAFFFMTVAALPSLLFYFLIVDRKNMIYRLIWGDENKYLILMREIQKQSLEWKLLVSQRR